MMEQLKKIPTIFLFFLVVILFFSPYFFRGKFLFPGNLLVSFYSPWKYEEFSGWERGIPNKPIGFDNLRFFYSLKKESLTQIREKKLPLWNPYNFSGNILLADSQSAVLYPLNLLFLFLPFMHIWSLLIVSIPLIAGIFTYLLLKVLNLSKVASFFGGISFAFSGFMVVWMEENPAVSHSAVWLPVVLYGIKKFIDTRRIRFWLTAILALVFSVLAGHLQISIYLWIFALVFMIYEFRCLKNSKKKLLFIQLLAIFLFSFLISAIQLFPSFAAYLSSPRITASAEYLARDYLAPLTFLTTLVVPDIYGNPGTYNFFGGGFYYDKILYVGLIPFVFAIYEILSKKRVSRFFLFLGIIILMAGFNNPLSKIIFWLKIPFFSTATPSRIFYLFAFCLSVLAAYGFDNWLKEPNGKVLKQVFFIVFSFFFLSAFFVLVRLSQMIGSNSIKNMADQVSLLFYPGILFEPRQILISLRNLAFPFVVFLWTMGLLILWFKQPKWGKWLTIFLLISFIFHQFYFFKKSLYSTDDNNFIFPETSAIKYLKENSELSRFIGVGQARVPPNLLTNFHLFSPEGLDPVFSRRYGELMNMVNTGIFVTDIPRIEARLIFDSEKDFENKTKLKALSFLGIKFLLVPEQSEEKTLKEFTLPENQFEKVWQKNDLSIWQNNASFPRCWLVNNFIVESQPEEIIKKMFSENIDLKTQLILEEDPMIKFDSFKQKEGKLEIVEYNTDSLRIKTETSVDSVVFCTDNFFPGWKAKINGKESKIYRANYTFRAVVVLAGSHEIIFSYEPLVVKYGILISAAGLLATAIFTIFLKYLR